MLFCIIFFATSFNPSNREESCVSSFLLVCTRFAEQVDKRKIEENKICFVFEPKISPFKTGTTLNYILVLCAAQPR